MSTAVTALLVAVVGVTGTLFAPVLAQRLFMKNRQLELDSEHRQRLEERQVEVDRAGLDHRRDVYVRFNASARSFRQGLKNLTFDMAASARAELESARKEFNGCYSEVQLIAPGKVLEAAHLTSSQFAAVYGRLKVLEATVGGADALERANIRTELNESVRDTIGRLRESMREDLGAGS